MTDQRTDQRTDIPSCRDAIAASWKRINQMNSWTTNQLQLLSHLPFFMIFQRDTSPSAIQWRLRLYAQLGEQRESLFHCGSWLGFTAHPGFTLPYIRRRQEKIWSSEARVGAGSHMYYTLFGRHQLLTWANFFAVWRFLLFVPLKPINLTNIQRKINGIFT